MTQTRRVWDIIATTPRLIKLVWEATPQWLLLSLGVTGIRAFLPASQLIINKMIVDRVIAMIGTTPIIWQPLLILVAVRLGLSVLYEILNQANSYVSRVLRDEFTLYANAVLLQQAIRLDVGHYESSQFYDTLSRAQQSGSNYPVRVMDTLNRIFGQIISLGSLLALLLRFNPAIALLLLFTAFPAFWVGVRYSGKRFWMLRRETQAGRLADYLQQVLTQQEFVKEIRLFNLGDYLQQQWHTIRTRFNRKSANLARQHATMRGVGGLISNIGFYGAYIWTLVQTVRGQISLGDFTMYTGAFNEAQNLIPGLLENIASVYESNLYVSQYFEFLNLKPTILNPANPKPFPQPLQEGLSLKNVSFTYPGSDSPTLRNLNLTVKPNESIALVGVNGAGKTTLLKLITRLYDVTEGEITFDGIPIQNFELTDLRANIGVLYQDFARYYLSVQDNIGFGNLPERENLPKMEAAAQNAGAGEIIDNLVARYETLLGKTFKGGIELSGGQWQKIGMARAFMSDAPILILDEPTAALDAIAEFELFQKFRTLTQGKMTFFVSHRFSTVLLADRIVVLENSEIVEIGSHQALMANNGLYAQMFNLQASSYMEN
ncbi:ABC transporter ATP-binding protein [Spirulina sp. CS-785/01]|uniref:ABC transporter ATP-binding protein n=1 Tax=Spirulina sp. CS-785/01 TaxID=3021716 RepID=UPI00232B630E|nr:ABC transporter ATP-binding protein [Spirulina sp. CS-785/01]MDB9312608.1 ABC transporter ATP-binding protein [Spirulina sp. CS-785/01]